jgi:hypothetical protein
MPVLDRLLGRRHELPPGSAEVIDAAWGAVKVRVDAASDMYWQTPKEVWDPGLDFPPIRVPFPTIWMEWNLPNTWLTDGGKLMKRQATEFGVQQAALISTLPNTLRRLDVDDDHPIRVPAAAHESYVMAPFTLREGIPYIFPAQGYIHVDARGVQIGTTQWVVPDDGDDRLTKLRVDHMESEFGRLVMLAIGLMNCKNVKLPEHQSSVPIGRRQRRRNPGVKYHTIEIPGHTASGSRGAGDAGRGVALHRVRGHFKTYTADAPLLGKYVGTYWWDWQVRGDPELGTHVTDYKIADRDVS